MSPLPKQGLPTPLGGLTDGLKDKLTVPKLPIDIWRLRVVDFDNVPSGSAVDAAYSQLGVRFASITTSPAARWSAYACELLLDTAKSGKNVLSLHCGSGWSGPYFDAREGAVEVTFDSLQSSVSVWALPLDFPEPLANQDNRPFIEAFDANGAFLGRHRTALGRDDLGFFGEWQQLTYSSQARNIKTVRLSCEANGPAWVYSVFDSLTFSQRMVFMP
jgi:hypothetical protein